MNSSETSIAVLIPCYNEAIAINKVIRDFKAALPEAKIYVFDNNSSDNTGEIAHQEGAIVIKEKRQGKGFVLAAMLKKVDADYYILVDGDDTYPAEYSQKLLEPLFNEEADMMVGSRLSVFEDNAFRPLHIFGNKLVCRLINSIFHSELKDPMSGMRSFTRELAEELPVVAKGFDVETEMTLQLLYRRFVIKEITVPYRARPKGSSSKLRTFSDGTRVLMKVLAILMAYKPLTFFGALAIIATLIGLFIGSFVIFEYIEFRYIYSVPKAILAASLIILATILTSIGIIINTLNFRLLEMQSALSKQIHKKFQTNQSRK
jgi:glycosyltransferase involved in cell wall biosynthesis